MLSTSTVIGRLLLAATCGAMIGIERELNRRAAGFRTHTLVSLGSCLFTLISFDAMQATGGNYDAARIAAQVVSGIGFLGAGTILQRKNRVSGLTTAATLWLSAGIGMGMGVGYYAPAAMATIVGLITLASLKVVSDFFTKNHSETVELLITNEAIYPELIKDLFASHGINVRKLYFTTHYQQTDDSRYVMELVFPEYMDQLQFFKEIRDEIGLSRVRYITREGTEDFELLNHEAFCHEAGNEDNAFCRTDLGPEAKTPQAPAPPSTASHDQDEKTQPPTS